MNWIEMQKEHREWLAASYPDQPVHLPVAGIFEELGEAAHCLLKHNQKLQHGEHPRYIGKDWMAELQDAIGDAVIYLSSACCTADIDLESLMRMDAAEVSVVDAADQFYYLAFAGEEAAYALRVAVRPVLHREELYVPLRLTLIAIKNFCSSMGFDFDNVVYNAWCEVKQRRRS